MDELESSRESLEDKLMRLKAQLQDGIITEEEYRVKRAKLLETFDQ